MTIRDDGSGFDPVAGTAGLGVIAMRERIDILGGRFRITSAPGAGTTVTAEFPVRRIPAAAAAVPARARRQAGA